MVARIQQSGNFCPWIERFKRLDFVNEGIDQQVGEAQVCNISCNNSSYDNVN